MISIIIPTHNREKYLIRALNSLANQNFSLDDFELVVVDDGSNNKTKDTIQKFNSQLNIKYIRQNHLGVSQARNLGIKKSRGEIIIFFDDDAIADKNWLKNISQIMKTEDVVTGRVKPIKNNIWQYFAPHYNQGNKPIKSPVLLEGNCVIKRKVFEIVGRFDSNLDYGHEGEEFISRARQKYKIMYYPEMLIYHDYASGLINYFKKQIKFGEKTAYLKIKKSKLKKEEVKNFKLNKLPFSKKIYIKIIAKIGSWFHKFGYLVGYFKYK